MIGPITDRLDSILDRILGNWYGQGILAVIILLGIIYGRTR